MDLNKPFPQEESLSAVLVIHELATDSLILTKRSEQLRNHPGEICFPGGRRDPGDVDLYATALRELHEELGIDASRITLVRALATERTLLGTIIHPWLVTITCIQPYSINLNEVTALVTIPMPLVRDPQNYRDLLIERSGYRFKSCEFLPHEELVWGATARIMQQLSQK